MIGLGLEHSVGMFWICIGQLFMNTEQVTLDVRIVPHEQVLEA